MHMRDVTVARFLIQVTLVLVVGAPRLETLRASGIVSFHLSEAQGDQSSARHDGDGAVVTLHVFFEFSSELGTQGGRQWDGLARVGGGRGGGVGGSHCWHCVSSGTRVVQCFNIPGMLCRRSRRKGELLFA